MIRLGIKKLDPRAIIPAYQTEGSACFDLHAVLPEDRSAGVWEDNPYVFDTGLAFEIPAGWCMKIYSRSGHGFNKDVRLANCVGIIDADYKGSVKIKLSADAGGEMWIKHGDRIAQAMLERVEQVKFAVINELTTTQRGADGFGSTDKKGG